MTASAQNPDMPAAPPDGGPFVQLAARMGVSPGRLSTVIVALVVAFVLTFGGLPPVLRARTSGGVDDAVAGSAASSDGGDATGAGQGAGFGVGDDEDEDAGGAFDTPPVSDGVTPTIPTSTTRPSTSTTAPPSTSTTAPPAAHPTPPSGDSLGTFATVATGVPTGLAVGSGGTVYVTTAADRTNPARVLRYRPDGEYLGSIQFAADGPDRPVELGGSGGAPDGSVLIVDSGSSRLLRIGPDGQGSTVVAVIPDVGPCGGSQNPTGCEQGGDEAPALRDVVVDERGNAYVSDAGQGVIWKVAPGGTVETAVVRADWRGGDGIAGLSLTASGTLYIASPHAPGVLGMGAGAIFTASLGSGGIAGVERVVTFEDEGPVAVAPAGDGRFFVVLRDVAQVSEHGADGTELGRIGDAAGLVGSTDVVVHGPAVLISDGMIDDPQTWQVLVAAGG